MPPKPQKAGRPSKAGAKARDTTFFLCDRSLRTCICRGKWVKGPAVGCAGRKGKG